MALAYPEGECFFRRAVLNDRSSEGFKANDPKDFASHFMVEFVWNRETDHGAKACNSPGGYGYPRSGYRIVRGSWWKTDYGCWTQLPFQYGPSKTDIKRRVQHGLCTDGNKFKQVEKGGADEAYFMLMPMPTVEERWVWIDRMAHIRAVYFPVNFSVDKDHPDLCSYVQVSFAMERKIRTLKEDGGWREIWTHKSLGLRSDAFWSVGFDVTGLIELLSLPRQLRKDNCYNLGLIKSVLGGQIKSVSVSKTFGSGPDISWADMANANYGLDLTWKPCEKSSWMENYLRNVLTIATGFVPVVGALVQVVFSVGWELISQEDPQAAYELLKNLAPGIDLTDKIISELIRTAKDTQRFLPDGWDKMGLDFKKQEARSDNLAPRPIEEDMDKKMPMLLQGEILASTGTKNDDPKDEEPGTVIKENAENATEGVKNVATDVEKTAGSIL
ncbi:hypothetical protein ACLMJK_009603 [Lecanora helva]